MDLFSDAVSAFRWAYISSSTPLICKFAIESPPDCFHEKLLYFHECVNIALLDDDILHLLISEEHEAGGFEISPNITAELNDKGELINKGQANNC